ncbi:MAG: DUF58 domain-containing protein [Elusimicrobiota bacterium]|jgi:uncharacterized protein (DUF58 family)|nr:DUF58 domain-containing protein [Elusimicrobiota bacterium]
MQEAINKEILKKQIKRLEIRSNKLVNEVFAGQYQSVFRGQGIEFAEVREYQIGDDFRNIDRNVSARYGKPYIKLFSEERELTVIFLIDISSSQYFGSSDRLKSEISAEVAAILAFSALKNNDRAGMLSFTDRVEKIIPPKKGKNNILRIINEILSANPTGTKTSISTALKALNEIWRRRAVIFLISDFQDGGYEKDLAITARKHDLVCIKIDDDREKEIPSVGLIEMLDPESDELILIDSAHAAADFKKESAEFDENTERTFKRIKADYMNLNTRQSYVQPLIKFFKEREMRRGR